MEEQTPVCWFLRRYNRLQDEDNRQNVARFQLTKLKIGLFFSFLAVSASMEVLLASSCGKSAFPNDTNIVNFLTNPLRESHKHFTNGTILGMGGLLLSLVASVYFVNRLWSKSNKKIHLNHPTGHFFDHQIFAPQGDLGYKISNYYQTYHINPNTDTLAVVVPRGGGARPMYVGIPYDDYTNAWCGDVFKEEIKKLIDAGSLPKDCYYDRFIILPINACFNLQNDNTKLQI